MKDIFFRKILSELREAVIAFDYNDNLIYFNQKFHNTFISDLKKFKMDHNAIIPEDFKKDFYEKINNFKNNPNDEVFKSFEAFLIKKDSTKAPFDISLYTIEVDGKNYLINIMRDITEKVEANHEIENLIEEMQISKEIMENNANEQIILNSKLYEQQEELKQLNAAKDKFFSIIAHDLKNPFQSLIGYSEILAKNINTLPDNEVQEFSKHLHLSATKLFKLLENLLHWSRIQRDAITVSKDKVDIFLLAEQNVDIANMTAKKKNIQIKNKIKPGSEAYADANMLNTIFRNLLSNAIKFTPEAGTISLSSFAKNNMIHVRFQDTGIGMEQDDIKKLFRIDKHHITPGTNNEQGTGLGLILCKELIEKNDGSISVESYPKEGTIFTISIPVK